MIELLKAGLLSLWEEDNQLNRNMLHDLFMENGFPLIANEMLTIAFVNFTINIDYAMRFSGFASIDLYTNWFCRFCKAFLSVAIGSAVIAFEFYKIYLPNDADFLGEFLKECERFNQQFGMGVIA